MADDLFSTSWYQVSGLRPKLRTHARISRHRYRGESWYVLHDRASGRTHRFTPQAWFVLGLMDGQRTLDAIWRTAVARLADAAPTQDEVIQLLAQMHAVDMVQGDLAPESGELSTRHRRLGRRRWQTGLRNPLALRIPLWDPNVFLARTQRWVAPLFSPAGAVAWLLLVGSALALVAGHWEELSSNLADRVLSTSSLVVLLVAFPLVKALHELGHGWATKVDGGEVHEMGIMFLVFMPVPYVDSSAANEFRSKWARARVGAAGMLFELALAAVATFAWVALEPGLARSFCFNVMLIAGVSTVLFNANPLLKYDGYFILSDLLEIPNLAARSTNYWGWLLERHLFRMRSKPPFGLAPGERRWLIAYAPLAIVYRLMVVILIALFIASEYLFVGVLFAIWGVSVSVLWPLAKALGQVVAGRRFQQHRVRVVLTTAASVGLVGAVVFWLPVSHHTMTEGVLWLPEDAQLRARASGFAVQLVATPDAPVARDELILRAAEPSLAAQRQVLEARVAELEAQLASESFEKRVKAELTRRGLEIERAALARTVEEIERLDLRSAAAGVLVVPRAADLPGRFIERGQQIGHVAQAVNRIVRVIVPQEDIELVRHRLQHIAVRLAPRLHETYPARLLREVPAAQAELPSRALAADGGGEQVADPRDPQGTRTLQRIFQFDLELPADVASTPLGSRAYVRLQYEREPVAPQVWRRVRQLFLSRFDV
jgi:putative peptide zinc metalloprotease protein